MSKQNQLLPTNWKTGKYQFWKGNKQRQTLPKFVQTSTRILYTPPMKTLENNIFCGMLSHSFKIATVSPIDKWDKVFKNGQKKIVEDSL